MTLVIFMTTLCWAVVSAALSHDPRYDAQWNNWKAHYEKTYSENEEAQRRAIWEINMKKIEQHNREYSQGKHSFTMAMNVFGDLSAEEFPKGMILPSSLELKNGVFQKHMANNLPKNVDWRDHGYVTPVPFQSFCNSSWAFSAVGAIEGQIFRKTGKLVSLSAQNLVDCAGPQGGGGCTGGLMDYAFLYVMKNGGINSETSYPYKAQEEYCKYNHRESAANVTGFMRIPQSENALMYSVANVGPVSVLIDGRGDSFKFYDTGIYYNPNCNLSYNAHAVLVVGYGEESDGRRYWIIKNSWGDTWGLNGYMKLAKDQRNHCGIATYALYPTV